MSYFDYHNRLKQLLKQEQYVCVEEDGKPFVFRFIFPRLMKSYPIIKKVLNIVTSKNVLLVQ